MSRSIITVFERGPAKNVSEKFLLGGGSYVIDYRVVRRHSQLDIASCVAHLINIERDQQIEILTLNIGAEDDTLSGYKALHVPGNSMDNYVISTVTRDIESYRISILEE